MSKEATGGLHDEDHKLGSDGAPGLVTGTGIKQARGGSEGSGSVFVDNHKGLSEDELPESKDKKGSVEEKSVTDI